MGHLNKNLSLGKGIRLDQFFCFLGGESRLIFQKAAGNQA